MKKTSLDAYEEIRHTLPNLREKILSWIKLRGGLTIFELVTEYGLLHQTATARLCELRQRGLIVDSGETRPMVRPGRKPREATIWIAA